MEEVRQSTTLKNTSLAIKHKTEAITGRKNLRKKTIGNPKKNESESDSDIEIGQLTKEDKLGDKGKIDLDDAASQKSALKKDSTISPSPKLDIDSTDIDLLDLRKQLGFVTQDAQLFSGTIRENLLFVKPNATDEELYDVMKKASCQKLLDRADDGLNSTIGEGGIKVSGGEKQRLSIARAILRNPNLLIFDEATSALDSITEEEINETIRAISDHSRITVLIAHRLSTVMHADRIFVLEQGKIIEEGKHDDLVAEKGLYYAMWRQQIGERK